MTPQTIDHTKSARTAKQLKNVTTFTALSSVTCLFLFIAMLLTIFGVVKAPDGVVYTIIGLKTLTFIMSINGLFRCAELDKRLRLELQEEYHTFSRP